MLVPVRVCDYFGVPIETRRVYVSSCAPLGRMSGVMFLTFFLFISGKCLKVGRCRVCFSSF